jgi:hypothetical protein
MNNLLKQPDSSRNITKLKEYLSDLGDDIPDEQLYDFAVVAIENHRHRFFDVIIHKIKNMKPLMKFGLLHKVFTTLFAQTNMNEDRAVWMRIVASIDPSMSSTLQEEKEEIHEEYQTATSFAPSRYKKPDDEQVLRDEEFARQLQEEEKRRAEYEEQIRPAQNYRRSPERNYSRVPASYAMAAVRREPKIDPNYRAVTVEQEPIRMISPNRNRTAQRKVNRESDSDTDDENPIARRIKMMRRAAQRKIIRCGNNDTTRCCHP